MNHLFVISITCALTGCLIVPATKTTTKKLGTEDSGVIEGAPRGVKLTAEVSDGTLDVRATYLRDCERKVLAVTQTTTTKHASLGGSKDPRARAFGVLLAPVLIPISAAITGLTVVGSNDKVERHTTLQSVKKFECVTVAAGLPVELVLASGRALTRTTDDRGMIELAIPELEPYRGQIVVRSGAATDRADYSRPVPAITAIRDATRVCAARHQLTGELRLKVTVGSDGTATQIRTDLATENRAELMTCVGTAIAKLRFPETQRGVTLVVPLQLGG